MDWKHPFGRDDAGQAEALDAEPEPAHLAAEPLDGQAQPAAVEAAGGGGGEGHGELHGEHLQHQYGDEQQQHLHDGQDGEGDAEALPAWADASRWQEQPDGALVRVDCEPVARWQDCEPPGPACSRCGDIGHRTDGAGNRRCVVCDAEALGRARELAEVAAGLRARYPSPAAGPTRGGDSRAGPVKG